MNHADVDASVVKTLAYVCDAMVVASEGDTDLASLTSGSFYVDNWLASFSTIEEVEEAVQATVGSLSKGGFRLAQWASSHAEVINQLKRKNESLLDLDLNNSLTETGRNEHLV